MYLLKFAISLAALFGLYANSQAEDIIDQIAQRLAQLQAESLAKGYYRIFPSGLNEPLLLASNAPVMEVTTEALKKDDPSVVANFTLVSTRKVRICGAKQLETYGDPNYTAVLVTTARGSRVALLQFQPQQGSMPGHWWHRVYDPERLLNQPHAANSHHNSQWWFLASRRAAVAVAERSAVL